MQILFSEDFKKDFSKIKDRLTLLRIAKQLKKISETPDIGKPLQYNLKNHRSIRIPPFRIIYRVEGDTIFIISFDHRKDVYK
ncbi:type II toxin-antitoxin system RelE/ParE family toxin [Candidatus Woesearchaeota archaeon]|nr:type II toxin-antitoxin system RelE/ParE family toxin [Candidatus Woesearchaeota archaeon]